MINQAIEAMTRAYTADFELYHDHHDPELEEACRAAGGASGSEQHDGWDPATPAGASAFREAAAEEEARELVRRKKEPPSATPDLLGAQILLQAPRSEPRATGQPALALVVGLHPPSHSHAIIAKLASGELANLTWTEFKSARRNLFGKDLSAMAVPAWGPDDNLPLARLQKSSKEKATEGESTEEESELESSPDESSEGEGAARKRPPPTLSPHRGGQRVRPRVSAPPNDSLGLVGLQVRKKFSRRFFSGKITEALPPTEEDEEWLWQINYEDGDPEQLNYEELSKVIVRK